MKLKIMITSFLIVLLSLALTACGGNEEDNPERINSPSNPDYTGTLPTVSERTDVFSFELKESFSSREEVIQERERLSKAYNEYDEACYDDDLKIKARETFDNLRVKLEKERRKFLSEAENQAEILKTKEKLLDNEIYHLDLGVSLLYDEWQNAPHNQQSEQNYLDEKEKLAFAKKVQQQYQNGEVTIDEALEKLNIEGDIEEQRLIFAESFQ